VAFVVFDYELTILFAFKWNIINSVYVVFCFNVVLLCIFIEIVRKRDKISLFMLTFNVHIFIFQSEFQKFALLYVVTLWV